MGRYALRQVLLYRTAPPVLSDVLRWMERDIELRLHAHTNLPIERRVAHHMEHCNPSELTTYIRPWPRQVGENSRNGYDKLIPRTGIEIVVETDA